jgi:hypothetical protein
MTASYEWTEYHLTPLGWVRGTVKTDFDREDVEPPADRILSVRYIEEHTGYGGGRRHEERWRSDDGTAVDASLKEYGPAPSRL